MRKDIRIKHLYKDALGMWTLDLADGYITAFGATYIQCNTKKQCLWELENFVYKVGDKNEL